MLTSLFLSALVASFAAAAPSSSCQLVDVNPLPTSTPVPNNGTGSPAQFSSGAWVAGWTAANNSLSNIDWSLYSVLSWAFAITTPDPSVLSLDDSGPSYIPAFVEAAHQHNVVALFTLGGWTGSRYMSQAVTPQNRSTFVKAVLNVVSKYGFDGVEVDWEYPNSPGIGCNQVSGADSENFLEFLKDLRAGSGSNLHISAAVAPTPFVDSSGQPMTDVSAFAAVLDDISIMNYDINGQWSTTGVGPNSPLDDSCSTVQTGSATKAVKAWTGAGFPSSKIKLGVPAYSHTYTVPPSNAVDSSGNLTSHAQFTKSALTSTVDQCGNPEPTSDVKDFATLISEGFLKDDGTPADGMKYLFDECSQTPFLYDGTKQLMVSYDDPQSFAAKGKFIIENNLLGFSMWDLGGDYNNLLAKSLTAAAGVTDC